MRPGAPRPIVGGAAPTSGPRRSDLHRILPDLGAWPWRVMTGALPAVGWRHDPGGRGPSGSPLGGGTPAQLSKRAGIPERTLRSGLRCLERPADAFPDTLALTERGHGVITGGAGASLAGSTGEAPPAEAGSGSALLALIVSLVLALAASAAADPGTTTTWGGA